MEQILRSILFVILLSSCLGYKELPVEYDYSYKGRFEKYKSYDFFSQHRLQLEDTLAIRSAIESHMKFLGYKRKKRKPDLYLNYSIYEDSLRFIGYNQPQIEEWVEGSKSVDDYQKLRIDLTHGTLLIQVYDRKQNSSIWQGYATDQYKKINFNNERDIDNAVKSILNSYQFFAKDFVKGQLEKSNTP